MHGLWMLHRVTSCVIELAVEEAAGKSIHSERGLDQGWKTDIWEECPFQDTVDSTWPLDESSAAADLWPQSICGRDKHSR
jgi:hypothetical protein